MKSYQVHLETTAPEREKRLCQHSSAIFPVFFTQDNNTRLHFLNYWLLKNRISSLSCSIYLRDSEGLLIQKNDSIIDLAKAYTIEIEDLLPKTIKTFTGSIEISFSSTRDLRFPFPAVIIEYYGVNYHSVVHSAQRIFHHDTDQIENTVTKTPESGFNLLCTDSIEPFISIINGPIKIVESSLSLVLTNAFQQRLQKKVPFHSSAYGTTILYPKKIFDLHSFLKGSLGTLSLTLPPTNTFPRLIVGNKDHLHNQMNVTHTYYDLSGQKNYADYWQIAPDSWYQARLLIPLFSKKDSFTRICFYPIFSPTSFTIDLEIRDFNGSLLAIQSNVLKIDTHKQQFQYIHVEELIQEFHCLQDTPLSVRILARPIKNHPFPSRIKIALDIGYKNRGLPSNICTNLQPFNPSLESKPSSIKWAPIWGNKQSFIYLFNDLPRSNSDQLGDLTLHFYREKDEESITRYASISPHGTHILTADDEINEFLGHSIGWCLIKSTSPYLNAFYFIDSPSGVIGGDHGF